MEERGVSTDVSNLWLSRVTASPLSLLANGKTNLVNSSHYPSTAAWTAHPTSTLPWTMLAKFHTGPDSGVTRPDHDADALANPVEGIHNQLRSMDSNNESGASNLPQVFTARPQARMSSFLPRGSEPTTRRRIQACQRCKKKKLKCDAELPACKCCVEAGQACTMLDLITQREYERSYVADLEHRIQDLERQPTASDVTPQINVHSEESEISPQNSSTSQYVGHSSEINFAQLIIANLKAQSLLAEKTPKLTDALMSIRTEPAPAVNTTPNSLPNSADALQLIQEYLKGDHILFPFLSRKNVLKLYQIVYQNSSQFPETYTVNTPTVPTHQDLFRINMIFAIGSVELMRKGLHESSPLGYYVSAMQYFKSVPKVASVDAAQNILFVAEFSMLQDTGCSIWELARICMRTCLLLDLHQGRPGIDEETTKTQQIVFWACYSIDRIASTILGRPFAISDRDISAPPLMRVNHDSCANLISETLGPTTVAQLPLEDEYFVLQVQLRRLSSEISTHFYRLRRKSTREEIAVNVNIFLERIDGWRIAAGLLSSQEGTVYHEPLWLDYIAAKEKLSLARAAINYVVLGGASGIPNDLRDLCLGAGVSIIEAYTALFLANKIIFSRIYFYILFSASVSCIYCLSVECHGALGVDVDNVDVSLESPFRTRVLDCLELSVQVLGNVVIHLPDLSGYSAALQIAVAQIQGSRRGLNSECGPRRSDVPDGPSLSGMGERLDDYQTYQEQYHNFSTESFMDTLDWQNIGTEMWHFVEPEMTDFNLENSFYDDFCL